jgi:hypothetical protein
VQGKHEPAEAPSDGALISIQINRWFRVSSRVLKLNLKVIIWRAIYIKIALYIFTPSNHLFYILCALYDSKELTALSIYG